MIKQTCNRIKCRLSRFTARAEHFIHPMYFGAVFWEAHGLYGGIAGVLLAVTVVALLTGDAE